MLEAVFIEVNNKKRGNKRERGGGWVRLGDKIGRRE